MPEYLNMAPSEIKVAHFNPAKRIKRETLTGLLLSIQKHGILEPLALAYDYVLADGHRRLECARLLDLKEVPVALYSDNTLNAETLWVVLNSETMNLTPTQWLAAIVAGLPLETPGFPERLKSRVKQLIEIVGQEGLERLVDEGRSPYVIDSAQRILTYCNRRGDEELFKKSVIWLSGVGNAWAVRAAMQEQIPADVLIEAIEEGAELRRAWEVAR